MVDVRITASIQPHWHVYAMSGQSDGATHLSFTLPPDSPFALARPVKTAAAFPFESSIGGKTSVVDAYQGTAIFAMTLRRVAAKSATAPLVVNVRYQACSDTMCKPPKTEQLSLDLSSRPR